VAGGIFCLAASVSVLWTQSSRAETPPIAATVNGDPIYLGEVEAMYNTLTGNRPKQGSAGMLGRADALQQLIMRRLAEKALTRDSVYVTQGEVDKALAATAEKAAEQKMTLEQVAARRNIGVDALRHDTIWDIGWNRYLERNRSASLQAYFDEHHKDFDGTTVRASHILLRPSSTGETTQQMIERAKQIREEIEAGKLTFQQAAEKYSAGPSRRNGGDLGVFPRNGVMLEDFARTAFSLNAGEVSEPIATPFGVHLILVTEVHPGTKQWTEVVDKLTGPTTKELFEKVAEEEGKDAKITFTGKAPFFKPGTRELVVPNSETKP
jgi:peptidyl-prolyl cis-trans isomerase C